MTTNRRRRPALLLACSLRTGTASLPPTKGSQDDAATEPAWLAPSGDPRIPSVLKDPGERRVDPVAIFYLLLIHFPNENIYALRLRG